MTKFVRHTIPMFNNKKFLAVTEKLSERILKNTKKQKFANPKIHVWLYLVKASQQGV